MPCAMMTSWDHCRKGSRKRRETGCVMMSTLRLVLFLSRMSRKDTLDTSVDTFMDFSHSLFIFWANPKFCSLALLGPFASTHCLQVHVKSCLPVSYLIRSSYALRALCSGRLVLLQSEDWWISTLNWRGRLRSILPTTKSIQMPICLRFLAHWPFFLRLPSNQCRQRHHQGGVHSSQRDSWYQDTCRMLQFQSYRF